MNEHPLVPMIRMALLFTAAVAMFAWLPDCSLVLFGVNCFGWWGGSGCCSFCQQCTPGTTPTQVQIDWSGVVTGGGSCGSCASLNTTYVLDFFSKVLTCGFKNSTLPGTCGVFVMSFDFTTPNNTLGVAAGANFHTDTGGAAGQDCSVTFDSTHWTYDSGGSGQCDFSGTSVTATMLAPLR